MRRNGKVGLSLVLSEVELNHGPILGVFATSDEAVADIDEIEDRFKPDTLLVKTYEAGWRYDGGAANYRANFPEEF